MKRILDDGRLLSCSASSIDNIEWLGSSLESFDCILPESTTEQDPDKEEQDNSEETNAEPIGVPTEKPHNFSKEIPEDESPMDRSGILERPSEGGNLLPEVGAQSDNKSLTDQNSLPGSGGGAKPASLGATYPTDTDLRSRSQAFLVASGSIILAGLGIFFLVNEQRQILVLFKPKRRELMPSNDLFGMPTHVGTGDPPSSNHYGKYHGTLLGTRYLSTQCETCLETLQQGLFTAQVGISVDKDNSVRSKTAYRSSEAYWSLPVGLYSFKESVKTDIDPSLTICNQQNERKVKKKRYRQKQWVSYQYECTTPHISRNDLLNTQSSGEDSLIYLSKLDDDSQLSHDMTAVNIFNRTTYQQPQTHHVN